MQSLLTRLLLGGGGGFSPAALFSSGAEGVWYDPSDSSTLFSDTAGTTPCAAPGAGALVDVGLMLDKSKGLVLGSELVPDPDFNAPASWTTTPPDWVVSGGKATYTDPGSGNQFIESNGNVSIVSGNWYKVTFVLSGIASGTALLGLFDKAATVNYFGSYRTYSANGTYSVYFLATSSTTGIRIYGNSGGTAASWSLESFSIQTISGNHAISYNATTARPELSARVNLLTYSEQFDNAAWSKTSINTTGTPPWVDVAVAPDGTTTADKLIANTSNTDHVLGQTSISITSGTTYTLSAFFKGDASNRWVQLGASSGAFGSNVWANFDVFTGAVGFKGSLATASIVPFGNGWFKCIVTATANVTTTGGLVIFLLDNTDTNTRSPVFIGGNTDGVLAWGADLRPANIGANVPAYQRIADQYTYDTVGFPRYLRFDGVDDGMSTPANLNLSATDKATVFAGVRKLSDAAVQVLAELSAEVNVNNGAFACYVQTNGRYTWISRGTASASAQSSPATTPVPSTDVFVGIGDISSDVATLRIDGAQAATSSTDQGTGNYGTYPLYIGARNNASLWFNGYLYSLIVVGAAATAAQVSSTESWIAGKEGITL